jgi:lipopolysaccharide assembly outer membrane protein LptD (OstA)
MRGRAAGWFLWLGLGFALALAVSARAADIGEVRVLSGSGVAAVTSVTVHVWPDATVVDRTPGAKPVEKRQGPISTGETFADEVILFVPGYAVPRQAAIEVADPVVSSVRLFPEAGGTTIEVFVRQPVTYSVSRPSAAGTMVIALHSRTRAIQIAGVTRRGRPRVIRPKQVGEPEIAVDAESLSYDQQSNTLTARGGVTLTRGDTTLTADEVVYDRTNAVAEAKGHVVVTDPQATIAGDFGQLNLQDETGWVEDATAELEPTHYTVTAKRLDKLGGPLYKAERGVFTTCECGGLERPSWSLAGRETNLELEGFGVMHDATFRVKDVPVLWFPYFVFPANSTRQSGFLIPGVGFSNRRGYQLELPFYWAINKSSDATFLLDVETSERVGLVGEYRYVLSRKARGEFTVAYYNERIRGLVNGTDLSPGVPIEDIPEDRFAVAGHHVQPFYGGSRFYLDVFAVSDDAFLREVNSFSGSPEQSYAIRAQRYTTSQTGLFKTWNGGFAWGENVYYQDLIDPQRLALQRLPRIEANHAVPLLDGRLVGRLSGETVNFVRESGYQGLRGNLAPELSLPFHLGRVLNGSVTGQVSETVYHLTDDTQVAVAVPTLGTSRTFRPAGSSELPALDTDRTRELGQVRARLGTEISRVFHSGGLGFDKLKHTIEPEVRYLYVPQVGRPIFNSVPLPACSTIPDKARPGVNCDGSLFSEGYLFDEVDAINRRNFLSYGFTTRLLGRRSGVIPTPWPEDEADPEVAAYDTEIEDEEELAEPPDGGEGAEGAADKPGAEKAPAKVTPRTPPVELMRLSVLQGYDVSRELVGTSHSSDLDFTALVNPASFLTLSYNQTFNIEDSGLRGFGVAGVLREPWKPKRLVGNFQTGSALVATYRFVEPNVNRGLQPGSPEAILLGTPGVNEVGGALYLRLGDYVGFAFSTRYDLNTTPLADGSELGPHFLERNYLLRLISRCNCWVLEGGVSETVNPDEIVFRLRLTLVGLGSVGRGGLQNFVVLPGLNQPEFRGSRGGLQGLY